MLTEKCTELLSELIDLYFPSNGTIVDPCAGTHTARVACLKAEKSCIEIEYNMLCYNASFTRLVDIFDAKKAGFGSHQAQAKTVHDMSKIYNIDDGVTRSYDDIKKGHGML